MDWNAVALVLAGALASTGAGVILEWLRHRRESGQRAYEYKREAIVNFTAAASRLYHATPKKSAEEIQRLMSRPRWRRRTRPGSHWNEMRAARAEAEHWLSAVRVFCPDLEVDADRLWMAALATNTLSEQWYPQRREFEKAARKTLDVS
jgi:hypothetical protein